jgi:16S rRNA (cytosine1402-N4)-methyltransferase
MQNLHTPVLLEEVMSYLSPGKDKKFIDATLGYGGHTLAMLAAGSEVVGIDQDADMLEIAATRISDAGHADHFIPMKAAFSKALEGDRLANDSFDGVLFDLGVSSYQLDTPSRGFSFRYDAPLDMRMDKDLAVTAKDLINGLGKKELVELFHTLGEEKAALKLAEKIVDTRKIKPIETTVQLGNLIAKYVPKHGKIHPATKVFQALRMAVNSERDELKAALPSALSKLKVGGVLAVISFHSLEDKIVKDYLASAAVTSLVDGVITPTVAEVTKNPRSRSAKLRVARRRS